jgi:hypothetical protein
MQSVPQSIKFFAPSTNFSLALSNLRNLRTASSPLCAYSVPVVVLGAAWQRWVYLCHASAKKFNFSFGILLIFGEVVR